MTNDFLAKLGTLQKLATEIDSSKDGNKSGNLDTEKEISVFTEKIKSYNFSEAEMKNFSTIFGLEKSNVTTNNNNVTTPAELSKREIKTMKNAVTKSLEKHINKGVSAKNLMTRLKAELPNLEYSQLLSDVEYVLNLIPEYNSKEDVEKIYKNIKAELKESDKWNNFTQDVLKLLETQAEATQIGKEFENLKAMYVEVKNTMSGTDIVKEKGDNYKAYVEIVKDQLQEKGADGKKAWNQSYTKEAFKLLEDYAKNDAENLVSSRLALTEEESSKKIKKELEVANKGNDKYQKEAIKSLEVEREAFARKNTIENRQAELSNISREELRKEIGSDLFEKLNRAYLGTKVNAQGNYDLSELSKEIMTRVGIDYQVNRSKSDPEMDELEKIKTHLNYITGVKYIEDGVEKTIPMDFTEKEIKKLMDLCKIKEQKKDRTLKTAIKDSLPGVLTGAITGLALSKRLHAEQNVSIILDSKDLVGDILKDLQATGAVPEVQELAGGKVGINISQEILLDTKILDTIAGAGIGALTSVLMSLAFGKEIDEKSCISISDYDIKAKRYTNVENYKDYIASNYTNPEKVKAIHTLADTYYKQYGADWHVHYQQALRDMAGIGSKLNPEECRMMKYQTPAVDKTGKPDEMPVKAKQDKRPEEASPVQDCVDEDCNANIKPEYHDTTLTYYVQGGDSWGEIVKAFYPCLDEKYGTWDVKIELPDGTIKVLKEGAVTKLKRALAYENGKYNHEKYLALRNGGDLTKELHLPQKIEDCDRVDNAVVKKVKVHGNGKALLREAGDRSGYTTYTASDDCTGQVATGKTKQEALNNLKAKTKKEYANEKELLK